MMARAAASGQAVSSTTTGGLPGPPGAVAYRSEAPQNRRLGAVAAQARRLSIPLKKGDRIDLDTAGAEEIQRLPRIGPGLAARIVADREKNGPFKGADDLVKVKGLGKKLIEQNKANLRFESEKSPG